MVKEGMVETPQDALTQALIDAEDEIIFDFCQNHGGLEYAMPIIRKQFDEAGVDFRLPTAEGLRLVVNNLEKVSASLKGPDFAKAEKQKFLGLINDAVKKGK